MKYDGQFDWRFTWVKKRKSTPNMLENFGIAVAAICAGPKPALTEKWLASKLRRGRSSDPPVARTK